MTSQPPYPVMPQPDDMASYLTILGYARESRGRSASFWRSADGQEVLLPEETSAPDYERRIEMLASDVGRGTHATIDQILRRAAHVHFDVAPMRAAGASDDDGSIPLNVSVELYEAARRLVIASAGATIRRQGFFGKSIPAAAREHAKTVRVGQTMRGSYIIPIISRARFGLPEMKAEHLEVKTEESLFDRRVMATMARALGTLETLLNSESETSQATLNEAVGEGISRELCLAVRRAVAPPTVSEMGMSFEWAPMTEPPSGTPQLVTFDHEADELLGRMAKRLKTIDRPYEDVIYGVVSDLSHRSNDPERNVGVEALVGKRVRVVWMKLNTEMYQTAHDAHERRKVVVTGRLSVPKGERATMEVTSFGLDNTLIPIPPAEMLDDDPPYLPDLPQEGIIDQGDTPEEWDAPGPDLD